MPVRTDKWPAGTPCWLDLAVPDLEAAKRFYNAVLGWEFTDYGEEYGHYVICTRDGVDTAGLSPMFAPGMPVAWTMYFASDDAAATTAAVREAGGMVVFDPMQVMDLGTMALAVDPSGAAFGIWQAAEHIGISRYNEPGALTWEHAEVEDTSVARDFYSRVFGFSYEPMGNDDYVFATDGAELGGIGGTGNDSGEPIAPRWKVWFAVADVEAACAAGVHAGGKVVGPPEDSPFGRQARLLDPAGAELFVIAVAEPG